MKKLLRFIKDLADTIFGTKADELFWRFRHLFDDKWSEKYISEQSLTHPHRVLLVEKILKRQPASVLEIGCASGPNLILLAQKLPQARIAGIDISARAIETGQKYLELQKIKNVRLETGNVLDLKRFADKNFDVVFTDAALIYVDKNKIENVLRELIRIARKGIVLTEWQSDGNDSRYVGHWAHNYEKLFRHLAPEAEINFTKITAEIWPGDWAKYGYFTTIEFN